MITSERLMMPTSQIDSADNAELRNEVRRLRSEIKRLAMNDYEVGDLSDANRRQTRQDDAAYLLMKSEAE